MHLNSQESMAFAARRLGKKSEEKSLHSVPLIMKRSEAMIHTQITRLIKPALKFENKWVHIHYTFNQKMNLMYQETGLGSEAQNWLKEENDINRPFYKEMQSLSDYQYINLMNPVSLKYKKYLGRAVLGKRFFSALYLAALTRRPLEKQFIKRERQPLRWLRSEIEYSQQPPLKLQYHRQLLERGNQSVSQPEVTTDIESRNVVRQVKQALGAHTASKEYRKAGKAKNDYERAAMSENTLAELTNQIYGRLEKRLRLEQLRRGI